MGNFISILTSLTGGGAMSLDSIDGNALSDGDLAEVWTSNGIYRYRLDATASATENSPLRINPDTNAGTKSWCLLWTSARVGALVKLSSNLLITNNTWSDIDWEDTEYEDIDFWEGVTNPERLSVPVGITGVRFGFNCKWFSNSNGDRGFSLNKNGASFQGKFYSFYHAYSEASGGAMSPIIPVVGGTDYFSILVYQSSGGNLDLISSEETWFSIEATHFA